MAKRRRFVTSCPVGFPVDLFDRYARESLRLGVGGGRLVYQRIGILWKPWGGAAWLPVDLVPFLSTQEMGEMLMAKVKRLDPSERPEGVPAVVSDPELVSSRPTLAEYLYSVQYPDGSPRKSSSMTIFAQEGVIKAVLKDPDNERALWASGDTLDDLLDNLECMLDSDTTVWRAERTKPGDLASRKRKN